MTDLVEYIHDKYTASGADRLLLSDLLDLAVNDGHDKAWDVDREALTNGLAFRGLDIVDAHVCRFKPVDLQAAPLNLTAFNSAVVKIMKAAAAPLSAEQIIKRSGLNAQAIPYGNFHKIMRSHGYHRIAGVGYWRAKHYTNPRTRVITPMLSVHELNWVFRQHGWPISTSGVEDWTNGRITPSMLNVLAIGGHIRGLGTGLYVPIDQEQPFPMTANVAEALLNLPEILSDQDNRRLFRICRQMCKAGYGEGNCSRTSRMGRSMQTLRVVWNDKGLRLIRKAAEQTTEAF